MGLIGEKPKQWFGRRWVSIEMEDWAEVWVEDVDQRLGAWVDFAGDVTSADAWVGDVETERYLASLYLLIFLGAIGIEGQSQFGHVLDVYLSKVKVADLYLL
ncbi:hypothetical protein SO802_022555 [Lithocarpus litseifolius]|uniref:Uncharacterized protein n=1 Tax=Lithocarpus litseifolius TaxID=425828 RepID=A0AAW2C636_9ROSI